MRLRNTIVWKVIYIKIATFKYIGRPRNMNKIKLISMLAIAMFLSITFSTTGTAADLQGDIYVSIDQFIGLVTPKINLTEEQMNQTVTLMVNVTIDSENPDNSTYIVEDKLKINLDINNEANRSFILPRSVVYGILLVRDKSKITVRPIFGYLRRLVPVRALFKTAKVVDSLLGKKVDNITVPIKYSISSATYENLTENMTLHIYTMGFLPGNSDGISQKLPIIDHKKINLHVTYVEKTES